MYFSGHLCSNAPKITEKITAGSCFKNRFDAFFEEDFAKLCLFLPSLRRSESFERNKPIWNFIDGDLLQFDARQLFNDALFENRSVDCSRRAAAHDLSTARGWITRLGFKVPYCAGTGAHGHRPIKMLEHIGVRGVTFRP